MKHRSVFLVLLVFVATALPAAEKPTEEPSLAKGLEAIAQVFGPFRSMWRELIVKPAKRDQAVRYLKRLSNRLEALTLAKEEFAHELVDAKWPADRHRVENRAREVQHQVWEVRRAIGDFFETLPPEKAAQSSAVQEQLRQGLGKKWNSLEEIKKNLRLKTASREEIFEDADELARKAASLKSIVDALVSDMAQGD